MNVIILLVMLLLVIIWFAVPFPLTSTFLSYKKIKEREAEEIIRKLKGLSDPAAGNFTGLK